MRTSVLISTYKNDDPGFLTTALKSIYDDQTVKPDEIVLVWDGPLPEELAKAAEDFARERDVVKLVKLPENKGLGEALRIGAEQCTGEYIFRMDADDISVPDRFEKQLDFIKNHPEIDVLGTNIAEFNKDPGEGDLKIRVCPETHEEIVKRCKSRNPMNHVTVCMKREALEKVGGYLPLLYLEDYYLWARMIAEGCKLYTMQESLVYVRVGNGFIGRRNSKERIKGWKTIQDYMVSKGIVTKSESRMNMLTIKMFIYTPAWVKKFLYKNILRK